MHFAVGKQAAGFDFPGVEHLAAQREDRLQLLVAAGLGRAARGIAFDEEEFVTQNVFALAVGQFARQDGHARLLAFFDLLPGAGTRLRRADRQFGDLLGVVRVLVEPQFERVAHHARNQRHRIARI